MRWFPVAFLNRQLHVQHLPRVSAHRSIEYSAYNYLVKSSTRAPDRSNCLEQPITVCRRKRAHTQYILRVARTVEAMIQLALQRPRQCVTAEGYCTASECSIR